MNRSQNNDKIDYLLLNYLLSEFVCSWYISFLNNFLGNLWSIPVKRNAPRYFYSFFQNKFFYNFFEILFEIDDSPLKFCSILKIITKYFGKYFSQQKKFVSRLSKYYPENQIRYDSKPLHIGCFHFLFYLLLMWINQSNPLELKSTSLTTMVLKNLMSECKIWWKLEFKLYFFFQNYRLALKRQIFLKQS